MANDNKPRIALVAYDGRAEEIEKMRRQPSTLRNLSEIYSYPVFLPDKFAFKIEAEGRIIGEVTLKSIRWFNRKAEAGIFIAEEYRGQGYGKAAMIEIMKFAFKSMNLHRLEAEVIAYNKPTLALMSALGFRQEGILREAKYADGKYFDIIRFGMLREEFRGLFHW